MRTNLRANEIEACENAFQTKEDPENLNADKIFWNLKARSAGTHKPEKVTAATGAEERKEGRKAEGKTRKEGRKEKGREEEGNKEDNKGTCARKNRKEERKKRR